MAITRLTDIITVFENKWTYGDVKFGYETDVNLEHDTIYPLLLIQPPTSIIPLIFNGREEYEFEINFYNLYSQAAQSAVTLQQRWDNLQDLAMEWLDFVLKYYQDSTILLNDVEAYLNDESVEIERVKEVANDRLVQIKMTFTMSAFTKCFRPQSNYPTDYSDLEIWLKADSGVTFDIPSKKVSAWADQSGNDNSTIQATTANQPLRHGYDGAMEKAYLEFNQTYLESVNLNTLQKSFTIFIVGNSTEVPSLDIWPFYSYYTIREAIVVGIKNDAFYVKLTDNTSHAGVVNSGSSTDFFVGRVSLDGDTGEMKTQYNTTTETLTTIASWDGIEFTSKNYMVGRWNTSYLKGNIEEIIAYNRVLTKREESDVRNYLITKYKIN